MQMGNLFGRKIELYIGSNKYSGDNFDIDFDVRFDDDPEPNLSAIEIYNLSRETINNIKKGAKIILNAGYQTDIGTLMIGNVEDSSTTHQGTDRLTKLFVGDGSKSWISSTVNKSYKPGMKASELLKDLLKGFGLEIGDVQLTNDFTYAKGRTISGMLQSVVTQIVDDTQSKFYIKNRVIYIRPYNKGTETGFLLNSSTGLIGSPERVTSDFGTGYNVSMLLNHLINVDSLIKIESKVVTGNFRVKKGNHSGDFITECEVYPL